MIVIFPFFFFFFILFYTKCRERVQNKRTRSKPALDRCCCRYILYCCPFFPVAPFDPRMANRVIFLERRKSVFVIIDDDVRQLVGWYCPACCCSSRNVFPCFLILPLPTSFLSLRYATSSSSSSRGPVVFLSSRPPTRKRVNLFIKHLL